MTASFFGADASVPLALLDDPSRCPACFALASGARCPACGLSLRSGLLPEVWRLSAQAAPLLRARASVLDRVRAESLTEPAAAASLLPAAPPPAVPPATVLPVAPGAAPGSTAEASPLSVRSLLLGLGVLLVSVAAAIFLVVAWGRAGVGGRALLLGAVTAATAAGSAATLRRGLTATAEALAVLVVGFVALDAFALWTVVGFESPGSTYTAAVCAAGSAVAALVATRSPLVTPRVVAGTLAQLPLPLLALTASAPVAAMLLTVQVAGLVVGERAVAPTREWLVGRLLSAGVLPAAFGAVLVATVLAIAGAPADRPAGSLLLAALAGVAAFAVYAHRREDTVALPVAAAGTALLLLAVLTGAFTVGLPGAYWAVALATSVVALAGALAVLPESHRRGPGATLAAGAVVAAVAQSATLAALLLGPAGWFAAPWQSSAGAAASDVVTPWADALPGPGLGVAAVAVAAGALLVLGLLVADLRVFARATGAALVVAVLAALPGITALPHLAAVASLVALGAMLLTGGLRTAGTGAVTGRAVAAAGLGVLLMAALWSLAAELTTLVTFAALAPVLAGAAWARRSGPEGGFYAVLAAAVLVSETVAVALSTGVEPAVATACGAAVAAACLAAATSAEVHLRTGLVAGAGGAYAVTALLALSDVRAGALAAVAGALGTAVLATRLPRAASPVSAALGCLAAPLLTAGFVGDGLLPVSALVAAGCATVLVGAFGLGGRQGAVESVGAAAFALALPVAAGAQAGALWSGWSLLAGAAVAALVATRPDRRAAMVAAAVLICAASPALAAGYGLVASSVVLIAAFTALAVALAGSFPWRTRPGGMAVEHVGAVAYALALAAGTVTASRAGFAGPQTHDLSVLLTAGGVGAAVAAIRPERRHLARLSGALLAAALWARLAGSGVAVLEAYTVPPALVLLAVGLLRVRRGAQAGTAVDSWTAYRNGLMLALVPSLLAVLGDGGGVRPVLLAGASLAAVLWGAQARLRAPLALGGVVLAVDTVVQLAPYAGAMPRWIPLGLAGVLLLVVGSTYERRLRDVRRMKDGFAALG